jgi:hypothetical protein
MDPITWAAIISALGMLGSSYISSKKKIPGPTGQGQMGGFKPSAENFMKKPEDDSSAAALAAILGGSGSSAVDAAIQQPVETPTPPPNFAAMQEEAVLNKATADFPASKEAGFDIAGLLPYIQAASQVGGAISEANRPQPVALQKGHMGGYNPTVPDAQELLRKMLAELFGRR